tara:strand:+ start:216 stop:365 length:150 start_codon:yes stop_codon:yes gene_type:complete
MTKILLIILFILIVKSFIENFIYPFFIKKTKDIDNSKDGIIDVDYEEID